MQQTVTLRPLAAGDAQQVMEIFNYYVENSFAAYPQSRLLVEFYNVLMASYQGYPNAAALENGEVVGFGGLRAYSPMSTFSHTAEISYFISPVHTSKGLGSLMLNHFIQEAKQKNIETVLASISSLNEPSLAFHKKHGFETCGTLKKIGRKNGVDFDVVYMQKHI
jgi:phosphinothricin acetyltransferase